MSYVVINAIEVPEDRRDAFEERFAARAAKVGESPGFEAFELLRPVEGADRYLVYTRWEDKGSYEAWLNSPAFAEGHRGRGGGGSSSGGGGGPVGTGSELWTFDVIQSERS